MHFTIYCTAFKVKNPAHKLWTGDLHRMCHQHNMHWRKPSNSNSETAVYSCEEGRRIRAQMLEVRYAQILQEKFFFTLTHRFYNESLVLAKEKEAS